MLRSTCRSTSTSVWARSAGTSTASTSMPPRRGDRAADPSRGRLRRAFPSSSPGPTPTCSTGASSSAGDSTRGGSPRAAWSGSGPHVLGTVQVVHRGWRHPAPPAERPHCRPRSSVAPAPAGAAHAGRAPRFETLLSECPPRSSPSRPARSTRHRAHAPAGGGNAGLRPGGVARERRGRPRYAQRTRGPGPGSRRSRRRLAEPSPSHGSGRDEPRRCRRDHTARHLPEEAATDRRSLAARGVSALAALPLLVDGRVMGASRFSRLRRRREWPEGLIARLQLLADVFANVLARKRADEAVLEERGAPPAGGGGNAAPARRAGARAARLDTGRADRVDRPRDQPASGRHRGKCQARVDSWPPSSRSHARSMRC